MSLVYFFHWFWCACTILDKTFVDFFTFYHNVFSPQVKCNYYQQKLKEKINCQFTKSSNHPKAKFWRFSIKSCKILAAKLWKHPYRDLRWANIKSDATANPITNHCAGWHAAAPPAPKKSKGRPVPRPPQLPPGSERAKTQRLPENAPGQRPDGRAHSKGGILKCLFPPPPPTRPEPPAKNPYALASPRKHKSKAIPNNTTLSKSKYGSKTRD